MTCFGLGRLRRDSQSIFRLRCEFERKAELRFHRVVGSPWRTIFDSAEISTWIVVEEEEIHVLILQLLAVRQCFGLAFKSSCLQPGRNPLPIDAEKQPACSPPQSNLHRGTYASRPRVQATYHSGKADSSRKRVSAATVESFMGSCWLHKVGAGAGLIASVGA